MYFVFVVFVFVFICALHIEVSYFAVCATSVWTTACERINFWLLHLGRHPVQHGIDLRLARLVTHMEDSMVTPLVAHAVAVVTTGAHIQRGA